MALLFYVLRRQVARAQDVGLQEMSLHASKSEKARIDSSCTCGLLKHELKGVVAKVLNWKVV
jgi:hypothetical protein